MRFCDVRALPLLFAVLIGCNYSSNAQKLSGQLSPVVVQQTSDNDDEAIYRWDHHGKDTACLIPLPNRSSLPVTLRFRQMKVDGDQVGVLFLDSEFAIEVGKILSDQVLIFVRPGEVIPYHDQLYLVAFDRDILTLTRVTDSVPEAYHPNPQYLTIPRSESKSIRRRLFQLKQDDWTYYERVRVTHVAEDASYAEYEGKPYYGSAMGVIGDNTIELHEIIHQWANSTTDVGSIVPPIEIDGVGRLRGWVEFRQTLIED